MRKVLNRTKQITQFFADYYIMLSICPPKQQLSENKRALEKFRATLGEFPLTPEMAIKLTATYNKKKSSTRARNLYILERFYPIFRTRRDSEKIFNDLTVRDLIKVA